MDLTKDVSWLLFTIFVFFFFAALIIALAFGVKCFVDRVSADDNHYKEIYDFSTAVIIDTHISYSRYGTPQYYFVYKFSDSTIKQVEVGEQEYYENLQKNSEGS